jgi:hypothetical protein
VPKKGHGCFFKGCLTTLLVLVLLVAGVGALLARLPQQLGLWPSGASLLSGTPDRAGAAAILTEMEAEGIDTTGVTLYVMPVEGKDGTLAYAILDTSTGFRFPTATTSGRNPIPDMFVRLTGGQAAEAAGVAQVAIEYRNTAGQTLGVLTASKSSIHDFASGAIDETAFGNAMHGTFNPGAALDPLSGGSTP